VNSQVFPNMATGLMDTNPAIREQTVKVRSYTTKYFCKLYVSFLHFELLIYPAR